MSSFKKAQVSTQFNWMFVAIAGGIILMFFVFVITQVQSAQEAKLAAKVLNNFDAILTGSQVSPNTLNTIDSSATLRFQISCDFDGSSELTVPRAFSRQDISRKIIFTPDDLSGNQIFILVRPIEEPFHLDNAIMLADERIHFFFFNDTSNPIIDNLYRQLPAGLTKSKQGIFPSFLGDFRKIIVVADRPPLDLIYANNNVYGQRVLRRIAVNWLEINSSGAATLHTKSAGDSEFSNRSLPISSSNDYLYGLFSKDVSFFECTKNKITMRTGIVAQIYKEKAEFLRDTLTGSEHQTCRNYYAQAIGVLDDIIRSGTDTGLREINQRLLRASCPVIY